MIKKVSINKSEIQDALLHKGVKIGSEFEFKFRDTDPAEMADYFGEVFGDKVGVALPNFPRIDSGPLGYVIIYDSSVGDEGAELRSPKPVTLDVWLREIPKIFDVIKKYAYTDDSCGFHINLSFEHIMRWQKELNVLKLMLFLEEEKIYKFFESRKNNPYCMEYKRYFDVGLIPKDIKNKTIEEMEEIVRSRMGFFKKYYGVNFLELSGKGGRVEFRYLGGANYEKEWGKIKGITAMYIHVMALAIDSDYKRKEYYSKIKRLLQKLVIGCEIEPEVVYIGSLRKIMKKVYSLNGKVGYTLQELKEVLKDYPSLATVLYKYDIRKIDLTIMEDVNQIIFEGGEMYNVEMWNSLDGCTVVCDNVDWYGGIWHDGTWDGGIWHDGTWEDGHWLGGEWMKGKWFNGIWVNGQWHSGLWKDGLWKDGIWHDGTWEDGRWRDGVWKDGVWIDGFHYGGKWENGSWENGRWLNGVWYNGEWLNGIFVDGEWHSGTWERGFIVVRPGTPDLETEPSEVDPYTYWKSLYGKEKFMTNSELSLNIF